MDEAQLEVDIDAALRQVANLCPIPMAKCYAIDAIRSSGQERVSFIKHVLNCTRFWSGKEIADARVILANYVAPCKHKGGKG